MPDSFDISTFGVKDTRVVGDYNAAEEFLSFDEDALPGDADNLKTIKEAELEEAKKKAEAEKKKAAATTETEEEEEIDDILGELEDKKEPKEEVKDAVVEDKKEEDTKEEEEDKGNSYEELAKDLLRLGVFSAKENEVPAKTGQELLARFQEEGQLRATQWLDDFLTSNGDENRDLFDAIFIKGVSPAEYLPVYNEVQKFEGMDLTIEDNQKRVYREFYKRVGMDEDKVEKRLQKTIDYGDLESEVPDLHEKIVSQDKDRLLEMEQESQIQKANVKKADAEYKNGIQKILSEAVKTKEFKGMPVTEKRAREAFDFIYTPKYKTPNGQLLTEFDKFVLESKRPENLEQRLILAFLKLDNFDFKNIKKQAISEESKELFNSLASKVTKDKTRATKTNEKESGSVWSNL